jgi:hypothetical protein
MIMGSVAKFCIDLHTCVFLSYRSADGKVSSVDAELNLDNKVNCCA